MNDIINQFKAIYNGSAEFDIMDLILLIWISLLFWGLVECNIAWCVDKIKVTMQKSELSRIRKYVLDKYMKACYFKEKRISLQRPMRERQLERNKEDM